MSKCTAITQGGGRCKGVAIDSSGLCHAHHPDRAEARRRAASKGGRRGGRGRPVAELVEVKNLLRSLAAGVLKGTTDRADAAVAGQLLGTVIRAIGMELRAKEQLELEQRLEELEARAAAGGGRRRWG